MAKAGSRKRWGQRYGCRGLRSEGEGRRLGGGQAWTVHSGTEREARDLGHDRCVFHFSLGKRVGAPGGGTIAGAGPKRGREETGSQAQRGDAS